MNNIKAFIHDRENKTLKQTDMKQIVTDRCNIIHKLERNENDRKT